MDKTPRYLSYLLRMWQTKDGEKDIWSASLEKPGSQQRQGFATLDELFRFLQDQAAAPSPQSPPGKRPEHQPGGGDPPVSEP